MAKDGKVNGAEARNIFTVFYEAIMILTCQAYDVIAPGLHQNAYTKEGTLKREGTWVSRSAQVPFLSSQKRKLVELGGSKWDAQNQTGISGRQGKYLTSYINPLTPVYSFNHEQRKVIGVGTF